MGRPAASNLYMYVEDGVSLDLGYIGKLVCLHRAKTSVKARRDLPGRKEGEL